MDGENVSLLVAFAAGILSFASPCVLPLVPAYLGHMLAVSAGSPGQSGRMRSLSHAAAFVLGFSIVFVGFWTSLGLLGFALADNVRYMREVAGAALIFMGLHLLGIIRIPFLDRQVGFAGDPVARPAYHRSMLMGVTFAAGWTPCIGPVLGSIIGLAATSGTVATGAFLLLAYSAGMGIPFLAVALAADPASRWLKQRRRFRAAVPAVSGALVVTVGLLMLTNTLVRMNQFFDWGYV